MKKIVVTIFAVISLVQMSLQPAATANPLPNETAGSVTRQKIQNEQHLPPEAPNPNVIIKKEQPPAAGQEQGEKVVVRQLNFTGDKLIPETELQTAAQGYLGKELTITELRELCIAISQLLQNRDYAVAKAYLPKQDIVDGVVTIALAGGRYGTITVNNNTTVRPEIINREIACLKSGDYIRTSLLERAVLLLGDLSGVKAKAMLAAGSKIGTTDVTIELKPANKAVQWQLDYNNYGSYNVGPNELGLTATWNNLSRGGDQLYLRFSSGAIDGVAADNSKGLLLGTVDWQTPVGADGGKLSIGHANLRYVLGRSFAGAGFDGTSDITYLNWTKPLLRSRFRNLSLTAGFDYTKLNNSYPSLSGDAKQTLKRFTAGLQGDNQDASGINSYNLTWTCGQASLDDNAKIIDNEAGTVGWYSKLSYSLQRHQRVADRLALLVKLNGQVADKNLVSYEKLTLGGPRGVRAYGVSETSGDDGYIGTAELRWLLPRTDNVQLSAFCDTGKVTINHHPWAAVTGDNSKSLAGYGVGLLWNRPDLFSLNVAYAWRAGNEQSTIGDSPNTNGRLWVSAVWNL